ncbi:MAG: hypothetical protein GWP06_17070, partial [Actinobacteria bacterium]|nr:hypothetical protein [Actinomycetota bacterium]
MKTHRHKLEKSIVQSYLEKLELIIDMEHIERTEELQKRAFAFEPVEHIPTVIDYPVPEDEWPSYSFPEIFDDPAKMLLQELRNVYAGAGLRDDRLYGIRANYGTGIIASMFGCETRTFDNSLPIGLHISKEKLNQALEEGVPDMNSGMMGRVLDTVSYFRETLMPYPKLSKAVKMELFDIQGTFDNASIIWGSDIYLAFFDRPAKVHSLIDIVSKTISAAVKKVRQAGKSSLNEQGGDWNFLGGICLRNDSCVNISGEQYLEFVKPYDKKLISEFGGWIHFCGDANQWWQYLLDIPGLRAINPYQGEFYDLYRMYEMCESHRIAIVQWTTPPDAECCERIKTGYSRIVSVSDFEHARRAKDSLYTNG